MFRLAALLMFASVCGCGGGHSAKSDAPVHADASPDATLHAVLVTNSGQTPTLYEYRDGSGAWQLIPTPDAQGQSTIEVANDFVLLDVCAGSGSDFVAVSVAATVDDGDQYIQCYLGSSPGAMPLFAVTGTMNQPGTLTLSGPQEGSGSGTASPWSFSFNLPAGTYDAAAVDPTNTQLLLRRGVAVAASASGTAITPAFDLTTEGSAFGVPTFTITGAAASAGLYSDTQLTTPNGFFDLGAGSGSATIVVPTSLLQGSDQEFVEIAETTSTTGQYANLNGYGSGTESVTVPATIDMMPVLSGVTFPSAPGSIAAEWTTLPQGQEVQLNLSTQTGEQIAVASPAWLALHGSTKLAFDTTAANYQSQWDLSTSGDYFAELSVNAPESTTKVFYSSSFFQGGGASLRAKPGGHRGRFGGRAPMSKH
jgi:hypothetical protein